MWRTVGINGPGARFKGIMEVLPYAMMSQGPQRSVVAPFVLGEPGGGSRVWGLEGAVWVGTIVRNRTATPLQPPQQTFSTPSPSAQASHPGHPSKTTNDRPLDCHDIAAKNTALPSSTAHAIQQSTINNCDLRQDNPSYPKPKPILGGTTATPSGQHIPIPQCQCLNRQPYRIIPSSFPPQKGPSPSTASPLKTRCCPPQQRTPCQRSAH